MATAPLLTRCSLALGTHAANAAHAAHDQDYRQSRLMCLPVLNDKVHKYSGLCLHAPPLVAGSGVGEREGDTRSFQAPASPRIDVS